MAILAKALFDNLADAPDELSFRKGDVITVLEQDVDGLIGWWLCSLHGKQGIAPGNRLQEIKRRLEGETSPRTSKSTECFSFEDIDYDVPRSHEVADDYAIPRGTTSPDYDVPNANRPEGFMHSSSISKELQEFQQQFNSLPGNTSLSNEINSKQSGIESVLGNQAISSVDVYDVPTALLEDDLSQDFYDMPRNAADKEQSRVELFTNQSTDLSCENNMDSSAEQGSRGESERKQPLPVHKEPDIYTEIYDVPLVPGDQEKERSLERPLQGGSLSFDTNMNSVPEENRNMPRHPGDVVTHVIGNDGKRQSTSSTDSAKLSSEDDDYVDYQEIYGDGRSKDINVYDVPVQPLALSQVGGAPTIKRSQVSILQRINMSAVKGLKLDVPEALQRLSKLEQAVNGAVHKLLSFVTITWRNPNVLKPQLADIRDIAGKAKVALRLLTEFALSSLVNARNLPNQELSGKLSRAVEPLLETYYAVKLALQRLDDKGWEVSLDKGDKTHDELDLIMVHIRSVPENSQNLAAIIRTAATILYNISTKKSKSDFKKSSVEHQPQKATQSKMAVGESEQSDTESLTLIASVIKDTVDANFKPTANGGKWSPSTVRRVCGMDTHKKNSSGSEKPAVGSDQENMAPKLPLRLQSTERKPKDSVVGEESRSAPPPPQRKDSGEKFQHLRQKSTDKFPLETTNGEASGPPPKPKLDRKNTTRKSYKIPLFSEHRRDKKDVIWREHKTETEPSTPRRKCNSDPTQLHDHKNKDEGQKYSEKHNIATLMKQGTVHISDSDLPQSLHQSKNVQSLTFQLSAVGKPLQHRPLSDLIRDGGTPNGCMVSLNDRELLEFYKYEIDAQLFVLSEAVKGFFAVVDKNESPKVFVSSSKFIVLSAHKFVYIGDTLSKRIKHGDLNTEIVAVTNKLSNHIRSLVSATKSAALQYPASNAIRDMSEAVVVVNNVAVELYQIVKKTTKSS
ncbi:enhancer of filamentation 1-like isoform X2 [Oculina patagonica]